MNALAELLAEKGYLVLDGAMGTQLFDAGMVAGDAPESWNFSNPDGITAIHRSYVAAGSDIILTNSFGGTSFRLKLHGLDDRVREVNAAAARNARVAADEADRRVLVAGSMGPTGELVVPLGRLTPQEVEDGFAAQAEGLAEGGADILWLETLSALNVLEAGVRGARKASDLPIVATMSYDTAGRTMMGVSGTEQGEMIASLGLDAAGANCGSTLPDTEAAVALIRKSCGDIPVVSKANAGIPVWHGAELHYDGTPEVLAAHAVRVRDVGVSLIGACCGSGPEHIAMIAKVLSGEIPVPDVEAPGQASTSTPTRQRVRRGRRSRC
jgi:5-methyltetrahydrofolate--homocysteine methyltransferase